MSQLTANTQRIVSFGGYQQGIPVLTNTEIFLGSAVGLSGAYARQLVAGDIFVGFCIQHTNNNPSGGGASGALTVPLIVQGEIQLAIAGAANTDIGKGVYASDGNTFTYTASGNSRVGTVVRFVSTGIVIVEFYPSCKLITSTITDSTGGTPSTTFAAIAAGASYAQADMVAVKNALSQIALNLNLITQAGQ